MPTLNGITKRLLSRYRKHKDAEGALKSIKKQFFDLATAEVDEENLAQKTVWVDIEDEILARAHAERYHPGWLIIKYRPKDDGWTFTLREDPTYQPFTYINPENGIVFTKQVRQGQIMCDDERLQEEDPELWQKVTEEVRQLKDLDTLPEDQLMALQGYIYRNPPTVALAAPKKAKPEELVDM